MDSKHIVKISEQIMRLILFSLSRGSIEIDRTNTINLLIGKQMISFRCLRHVTKVYKPISCNFGGFSYFVEPLTIRSGSVYLEIETLAKFLYVNIYRTSYLA